ncbi:MAG: DNA repair protein RecN [Cytophagales bacterium]|nr:MAG: DNA repair protein RecN [Cytophagales bacterium]
MLKNLIIRNYALIEELEIQPHAALNIITGETGAGKSIMLGAVGLLLGNRADMKVLFNTEEKCVIEGSFYIKPYQLQEFFEENDLDYQDESSLRREIAPNGKSRAFVNDTPVNLDVLKTLGSALLDIHSQHDNLLLGDHQYQLKVVDASAENSSFLAQYLKTFKQYKILTNQQEQLQKEYLSAKNELDYNTFLLDEIKQAQLQADEQEKLESELAILENSEEVKIKLNTTLQALSTDEQAVNNVLRLVISTLSPLTNLVKEYEDFKNRIESCWIELKDVAQELARAEENIEYNPTRLEEVNDRLTLIYKLQKKHNFDSIAQLLALEEELAEKVNKVLNFDDQINALQKEIDQVYGSLMEQASNLSQRRQLAIPKIEDSIKAFFADLGMPNAVLKITQTTTEPKADGIDIINFLFSANKGIAPQEIEKVASGGEFSRLMLAVKYVLAGKTAMPTIIFDEIDTGISGEIAVKMGKMMKEMSIQHQIIAISHLHQIAAKGNSHYFVYKDDSRERTFSRMRKLSDEERIYEIAQMISGATPSESAIRSAKELLEL